MYRFLRICQVISTCLCRQILLLSAHGYLTFISQVINDNETNINNINVVDIGFLSTRNEFKITLLSKNIFQTQLSKNCRPNGTTQCPVYSSTACSMCGRYKSVVSLL
jgi:hypothetical protein